MVRTEHDIVSQVQSAKTDSEAADALICQYMGFIRSETVKFLHTVPENGHEDELSIAMLAFYEAVLAYEKSRGAFLPYAARAIKNRLIRCWPMRRAGALFCPTPPVLLKTGSSTTTGRRSATAT